jgi:hypothetical protein
LLEEGEPVYAYGYPLSVPQQPVQLTIEQLRELLGDVVDTLIDDQGGPAKIPPGASLAIPNHILSPRVSQAVIASQVAYYHMIDVQGQNSGGTSYVLDQPLNYGISGGPVVASETGRVHALCTSFQPVNVLQGSREPVMLPSGEPLKIPSLYSIVTRLSHPIISGLLTEYGVTLAD